MTNDTSRFGPLVSEKMAEHIREHKAGDHDAYSVAGCPSCLFRRATWPEARK